MSSRPRWQFWNKSEPEQPAPETVTPVKTRVPSRWQTPSLADPVQQQKLDQLRRRREMIAYDLERAEAAQFPDNPWQERINLLDESMATVEADVAALDRLPPDPTFPVPPVPITGIAATGEEPGTVQFQIGPEQFLFEEETDWDQRGGPVVRGQLRQRSGEAANLVPDEVPANLRPALTAHLIDSVTAFATNLRDRAVEGAPLPDHPTLADLAQPDLECGGWLEWGGASATCARRAWRRQQLQAEAQRLWTEREAEIADRVKWAERLPIARRRLADVDTDLAELTGSSPTA